ncbi:MAG TPA: hypothetical protein VGH38_10205 [Bryobacteraceae bacterium]|jgi:hypothetical protein
MIKVRKAYLETVSLNQTAQEILGQKTVTRSLCPAVWWFDDVPEVRRILGI